MDKILVTGAGYVGSVLVGQLLEKGYKVRAVDNFYKGNCDALIPYCSNENFEFTFGDVSSVSDVTKMTQGVDAVIHTAGIVGFPICQKHPGLSKLVNVIGTQNMVDQARHIPFIFTSTGSVYGKLSEVCTENSPTNPQSTYGEHKRIAEKIVLEYDNALVYRFSTGFGVSPSMRVNLLVNDLVFQAYSNRCITIFEADAQRSFINVKSMAESLIFGLENFYKLKYKIYNVGHPSSNWTKRQLAEYIKEKTGCLVNYAEIGKDLDSRNYSISFERINAEGWRDSRTIEDGIEELLRVCPLLQLRNPYS